MFSTQSLARISRPVRVLALFLAAVLAAAAFVAITQRPAHSGRAAHYLGLRGLELAAFNGSAHVYLRMPPITTNPKADHSTDIPLSSFSWGVSAPFATGGGGAGRAVASSIIVVKKLDKYTTLLLADVFSGHANASATIFVLPAVQKNDPEQLRYVLTDPVVSADHESVGRGQPTETLTLNFAKIQIEYLRSNRIVNQVQPLPPAAN